MRCCIILTRKCRHTYVSVVYIYTMIRALYTMICVLVVTCESIEHACVELISCGTKQEPLHGESKTAK